MGKRAVIYTAGMLFVSPMVYTKDVGSSGTLPAFKAGDPDCVLPEGLAGDSQPPATSSLLQVKSYRAPSAPLGAIEVAPAAPGFSGADQDAQASRRNQYGSEPAVATPLGPLGPTGPAGAAAYASAPPAWSSAQPATGVARQGYPQRSMAGPSGGMFGGYPTSAAMPSFGAWPQAATRTAPQHQPRQNSARSGSGSGMGSGSGPSSQPGLAAAPRQLAVAKPTPVAQAGGGYGGAPAASAYPTAAAAVPAAAPAGWMPYGRPAYPMPMMPRPVPYGAIPYAAVAAAPAGAAGSAVASPREAQLAAQVQQMEQRLLELEERLQRDGSSLP